MHKYLIYFILIVFAISSCKKNKITSSVVDLSISENFELNKILIIDTIAFIVGGDRYSKSKIYKLNINTTTLEECILPTIAEKKELYSIAKNSLNDLYAVGYGGVQLISPDTGKTWNFIQHNSWEELRDISFNGDDSVIIVGRNSENKGYVFRCDKYGLGNTGPSQSYNFEVNCLKYTNVSTCYIAGYGAILKSTNNAFSFDFLNAKNDDFKAMKWKDENTGIVVGYEGSILKTINAGSNWETIRNANNIFQSKKHLLDISNHNDSWIIVGEKGFVYYSTNNGDSWKELEKFTSNDIRCVQLINESKAIIVGNNGSLFLVDL